MRIDALLRLGGRVLSALRAGLWGAGIPSRQPGYFPYGESNQSHCSCRSVQSTSLCFGLPESRAEKTSRNRTRASLPSDNVAFPRFFSPRFGSLDVAGQEAGRRGRQRIAGAAFSRDGLRLKAAPYGPPGRAPAPDHLHRRRLGTLLAVFCTLTWALAPTAYALKTDSAQPIEINADRWDHNGKPGGNTGTSVYTGHVVITQGSIRITARQATLTLKDGKLRTALIVGDPATFKQKPDQGKEMVHGRAQQIHYNATDNTVELMDHARVHQGGELITANYIRYNTEQEKVIAHHAKQKQQGRVHIVIPPSTSKKGSGGNGGG